ncbi:MAG: hypothetical protein ABIG37_00830 [Nanoarchaeota archaeon]
MTIKKLSDVLDDEKRPAQQREYPLDFERLCDLEGIEPEDRLKVEQEHADAMYSERIIKQREIDKDEIKAKLNYVIGIRSFVKKPYYVPTTRGGFKSEIRKLCRDNKFELPTDFKSMSKRELVREYHLLWLKAKYGEDFSDKPLKQIIAMYFNTRDRDWANQ